MVFSTYRDTRQAPSTARDVVSTSRCRLAWPSVLLLAWGLGGSALGCEEQRPSERQPPPPPPPKVTSCDGPRRANNPANLKYFPDKTGAFCLDPTGSDKGYGEGADKPIDGICDLFDGECDIYLGFQVKRVVEARYVDGGGSGVTIDVKLSKFGSADLAYAMFTKRVVGDGDPAHPDTPKPIAGGGAAALGWGNAYLWRGPFLAEITYNDPGSASEEQIKAKADELLPPLVTVFGSKLEGDGSLPLAALALPEDKRLALGIRLLTDQLLGVKGTGPGALGYYRDGEVRWRVLSVLRNDPDQAKDVLGTLRKVPGATEEKGLGDDALRLMVQPTGAAQTEWIIARTGKWILGVGDEDRVLRAGMSAEEHHSKTLDQDRKRKLLKALLEGQRPVESEAKD